MGGGNDATKAAISIGLAAGAAAVGAASWAISSAVSSHNSSKKKKKNQKNKGSKSPTARSKVSQGSGAGSTEDSVSPEGYSHIARWLYASQGAEYGLELQKLIAQYRRLRDKIDSDVHPDVNEEKYKKTVSVIERDIERTMPKEKALESSYRRNQLRRVLTAYALYDPPVGYVQGMNYLVGFILCVITSYNGPDVSKDGELCDREDLKVSTLHSLVADGIMQEAVAFALLTRLMMHPRYHMRNLFLNDLPDVAIVSHQLNALMSQHIPELSNKLQEGGLDSMYFFEWYFTLFTYILPKETVAEVWDDFFETGWAVIFRVILTLLRVLEPAILECDVDNPMDMVTVLKSYQNYCTQHVAASQPTNQKTKGQVKEELRQADINAEWEQVESEEAQQGGMMLPPPPDLLTRSRSEFKSISPKVVEKLRKDAQESLENRRILRAAHQASSAASEIEQVSGSRQDHDPVQHRDEESSGELNEQHSSSSWDVVEDSGVSPERANAVWDQLDIAWSYVMNKVKRYPLSS